MRKQDYLEFEQIDRNDLRVSKPFQTDGGDIISVVLAANGNAIITSDSRVPKSYCRKPWLHRWSRHIIKGLLGWIMGRN